MAKCNRYPAAVWVIRQSLAEDRRRRHLWVRLGGPIFCGRRGCGVLMTEATRQQPCNGEENAGVRLLRDI